jgi:hypothetical protein
MKNVKRTFILLFVGFSLFSYAQQQFQLTNVDGVPYSDGQTIFTRITEDNIEDGEFLTDIFVVNLTDEELEVRTYRTNIALAEGMNAYVCFGICDSPEGTTFGMDYPISERDTMAYTLHLRPNGNFGYCKFQIDFTVPGESMTLYVEVDLVHVGVKEQNAPASLNAYPNPAPANSTINVSYTLTDNSNNHRLVIRNIMGAVVMSMPLNVHENKITFEATELKSGVYFYTLESNNQISVAKKLIVK